MKRSAIVAVTAALFLLSTYRVDPAAASSTTPSPSTPTRGTQLYTTNFDPMTFNQSVVGSSATLTQGPGPSLVCGVGSAGSKMIASVKNWSVSEPTSIWAEYDIKLNNNNGQYVASFYFEGIGGNHRHLHIDFSNDTVTLRDPNYKNEGPLVSVPSLNSGSTFHLVVVDTSPRYRVYVNGGQVIDYTDSFAPSTPGGFGLDCASQANGTGSDGVTNLSLYTVTGACGPGWSCADIGSPTPAGTEDLNGGTWTVKGGSSDIQGTADQFHYVWQTLAGNGSASAHITTQSSSNTWAKAGVMLRASPDPGAAEYSILVTPGNGVTVQWRTSSGGSTGDLVLGGTVPTYLQVVRSATSFSAYTSSNGSTWTLVPTQPRRSAASLARCSLASR